MSRVLHAAVAGVALLFAAFHAAAQTPRTHVDAVARAIEDNYFDESRGRQIATDLRKAAADGAFDALTEPTALASALTDRLKPIDRHFRVNWSADGAPEPPRQRMQRIGDAGDAGIRLADVLPGNIGHLSLGEFAHFEFGSNDEPARRKIDAALDKLSGVDALIVDLRGCRGGSPNMVGYLVSAFTPRGADIYNTFHSRAGTQNEAPREGYAKPRVDVPLYVLIDARTGSAAESFSYTLKNAKRATVVGETSRGAANPGRYMSLDGGYSVFVSTGSPVSPFTRTNWEGVGVAPDVTAPSADALDVALGLARKAAAKSS